METRYAVEDPDILRPEEAEDLDRHKEADSPEGPGQEEQQEQLEPEPEKDNHTDHS